MSEIMSNQEFVDKYLNSLMLLSKTSVDQRVYILNLLKEYFQKPFIELTTEDLRTFIVAHKEKLHWNKPATISLYIVLLRMFFRFLVNEGYITEDKNPARPLKCPRINLESELRVLTADEIKKIFKAAESPCIKLREKLLFYLAMTSGMRSAEICSIKKEHIDFRKKLIYIPKDDVKGKYRAKLVPLSEKAKHLLEMYLIQHPTDSDLVFENVYKRPLIRIYVYNAMREIIDLAYPYKGSWTKPSGGHVARHTFASRWIESGGDYHALKAIMGWKSFAQFDRYVSVSPDFIQKASAKIEKKLYKV